MCVCLSGLLQKLQMNYGRSKRWDKKRLIRCWRTDAARILYSDLSERAGYKGVCDVLQRSLNTHIQVLNQALNSYFAKKHEKLS